MQPCWEEAQPAQIGAWRILEGEQSHGVLGLKFLQRASHATMHPHQGRSKPGAALWGLSGSVNERVMMLEQGPYVMKILI